jgi:hypothetical protein
VTLGAMIATPGQRRRNFAELMAGRRAGDFPNPAWEYCSRWKLFGLPLVHVRIGDRYSTVRGPTKGWLAAGGYAVGGLFAFGAVAIAPVSIGFCAIGLVPFGAAAVGLVALGGVSFGVWSFGGLAVGWQAMGGCAIAWNAAYGNVSVAHIFAVGNDEISRQFLRSNLFFRSVITFDRYWIWWNLLWVVPMMIQERIIAWSRRRRGLGNG